MSIMNTKKIIKHITIGAIFLVPIFPLLVTNSFIWPFITGKAFYFRALVEIAFAAWLVLAFLDAKYRPRITPLMLAVTSFALITLVADLAGVNPSLSMWSNFERMEGWITIIHLSAFYVVIASVFGVEKKLWHRWFNVSLAVASVVALYGIFQIVGLADFHLNISRVDASFGNETYLAVYMIFSAFLAAYLFAGTKSKVYIPLFILFSFITYETQTRGAILGLVGGIFLAMLLYAALTKDGSNKWRWIAGGVIALMLIAGSVFWFNRDKSFIQNNPVFSRFAAISLTNGSNQARLYIFPMALKGAIEHPLLGWGQENFPYVFQAHYNPAMYGQEQWFNRAHNTFLDWLVAAGAIGLLAYLALYVFFLISVWKSSLGLVEKCILTGLLGSYTINNLFTFDTLGSYVMFYAVLAHVDSFKEGRLAKWLDGKPLSQDAAQYIVMPIVLVALVGVFYLCNVGQMSASRNLTQANVVCQERRPDIELFKSAIGRGGTMADQDAREQIYSCAVGIYWDGQQSRDVKDAFVGLAKKEIADAFARDPNDSRADYYAGAFLDQVGQFGEAEKYLERAHELAPERQIFDFELATSYLFNQRKIEQALAVLKQAYESAPEYYQADQAYAAVLMIAGKEQEARAVRSADQNMLDSIKSYMAANQYYKAFILFKDAVLVSQDMNVRYQQAEAERSSGMKPQAIRMLRLIENSHPELKESIEQEITSMQK